MGVMTGMIGQVERIGQIGVVVTDRCQGCGACLLTCPERAIRPSHGIGPGPLRVLGSQCTGCGECVEVCPVDAIDEYTIDEYTIDYGAIEHDAIEHDAIEEHRTGASERGPANESSNVPGNGSDT